MDVPESRPMKQPLEQLLRHVAEQLVRNNIRIVFAESCTGGLISATLARVPGISDVHCGSAVVYRLDTKTRWLGVPTSMLIDPGPVSDPVARAMAEGVLRITPEASLALAITGHLGPNAPEKQDGLVFVGIAVRGQSSRAIEHRLPEFEDESVPQRFPGSTVREQRQWAAVELVFTLISETISGSDFAC